MQYRSAPPSTQMADGIRQYLVAELKRIEGAFDVLESRVLALANWSRLEQVPDRVTGGELVRSGGELFRWNADDQEWQYVLSAEEAAAVFAFAAYAAANVATPYAITVGAGWSTIVYDTQTIATPRGVTLTPALGEFTFLAEGVYRVSVQGSINHDSSNQGRTTNLRLYNVTTGTPTGAYPIGIGRNVEDTAFSVELPAEVTAAAVGQSFRVEVGGGSTLSGAVMTAAGLMVHGIGEWRGEL